MADIAEPSADLIGDDAIAALPSALADRRELAIIGVERTRMPMVVTDARQADNPIVLANKAFLDLTGRSVDEVLGRNCRFLQGADTCPRAIAEIRAAIAQEREITIELLNYRKDGTSFWNQLCFSPVHDEAGDLLYFFGSQMDVTKRRQAQELQAAEYRLLREIDHRAMNALALVQGIVRLSRADSPERYAAAIQSRVSALARAHTMLADRAWTAVSLNRLLEGELQPHGLHRATLEGGDIALSAQLVQPLALTFHEMVFNAAVHGALVGADGIDPGQLEGGSGGRNDPDPLV